MFTKWSFSQRLFQKNAPNRDLHGDLQSDAQVSILPRSNQSLATAEVVPIPDLAASDQAVVSVPATGDMPLIEQASALLVRGPEGIYRPLLWHHGGPPVSSLLSGWRASWIYDDFAPVYLLELVGPGDDRATWYVDEKGVRLGDKPSELSKDHQRHLISRVKWMLCSTEVAAREARARYGRICNATRLRIESLLPNATYDRALEIGQAVAASRESMHEVARIDAKPAGQLAPELVEGWRISDFDGRPVCTATGRRSVIRFENVPRSNAYFLAITNGPLRMSRRVRVSVNGRLIAINPLHELYHSVQARFGYWIPPELVRTNTVEISLEHEFISILADEAFVLETVRLDAGDLVKTDEGGCLTDSELMTQFQSLGDNCQFGFVQRHFGAEPMGLLRFAGVPDLVGLIESGLEGLGEPGTVTHFLAGREYMVREIRHQIFYHTFRLSEQMAADEVIAENEVKLTYLRRKFIEDLEDGETIWVTRRIVSNDISEISALHAALRRYGPNKLLWVTPAPHDRRPGDVEWLTHDLLRGYLDSEAVNDPVTFNPDHWLLLCRNAYDAFQRR